jgi:hypothetical protein
MYTILNKSTIAIIDVLCYVYVYTNHYYRHINYSYLSLSYNIFYGCIKGQAHIKYPGVNKSFRRGESESSEDDLGPAHDAYPHLLKS